MPNRLAARNLKLKIEYNVAMGYLNCSLEMTNKYSCYCIFFNLCNSRLDPLLAKWAIYASLGHALISLQCRSAAFVTLKPQLLYHFTLAGCTVMVLVYTVKSKQRAQG